jgi:hypothetical protein
VEPVIREVALRPDVDALARMLRGAPGLTVLKSGPRGAVRPGDAAASFLACDPVEESDAWVPADSPAARGWNGRPAAPRWVGLVPYEATRVIERARWTRSPDERPLPAAAQPSWLRYDAVVRIDHASGRVAIEADDE